MNNSAFLDSDDFLDALQALLPPGRALPRTPDAMLTKLLHGSADLQAYFHARLADLSEKEAFPPWAEELLSDWEAALGLPNPCITTTQTVAERQLAVEAQLTDPGGQSRARYIALAAALGYSISITEYRPFVCGRSQLGIDQLLGDETCRFVWKASVPLARTSYFHCGVSQLGIDPLLHIARADDLECKLNSLKPAHTELVFDYQGA